MKVISVNVGQPRDVEWRGQIVKTAIWKQPAEGRVFVGRLNLEGDAQADLAAHGGEHRALMVYQLESYRYWAEFLKRSDFVNGQFGENLTVEGLADQDVFIGDRYQVGEAVVEVTQPRVTCYRLGIRMDVSEMPALVVAHRRPGFYLRIIREGFIEAGDPIEKLAEGPERMSVAEIDALLYTGKHPEVSLRKAVRIPALSQGWKGSFEALLSSPSDGASGGDASRLLWQGFRSMRVRDSRAESADVRSFEFEAEDGTSLPDAIPGQHIVVKLRPGTSVPPIIRFYSLCGAPGAGTYRIAVKRESQGAASQYLHNIVQTGSLIEVGAPRGKFVLDAGSAPICLISGGVGVTPVLAMLHGTAADAEHSRDIWWIYSTQNRAHHSFADEVMEVARRLPSFHLVRVYSRPDQADLKGRDYDFDGHLNLSILRQLQVPVEAECYLCGPAAFLNDVAADLGRLGVASSRIHVEVFGVSTSSATGKSKPPHPPVNNTGSGPIVTFARSGVSFRWSSAFDNLLEAAEACDMPVSWSCRSGVCHSCESGLISGDVRYSPEPIDRPTDGNLLICCSTPFSDVELDL